MKKEFEEEECYKKVKKQSGATCSELFDDFKVSKNLMGDGWSVCPHVWC